MLWPEKNAVQKILMIHFTLSFCPMIIGVRVLDVIYNETYVVTYFSKDFSTV